MCGQSANEEQGIWNQSCSLVPNAFAFGGWSLEFFDFKGGEMGDDC